MAQVEVIHQGDLLIAAARPGAMTDERGIRDWPDAINPRLDPEGVMLLRLAFPHNDGPDLRIVGMAKVVDSDDPVDVTFTLPGALHHLVQTLEV